MATDKTSILFQLLSIFLPFSLALNLVNFFWLDIVFALFTTIAIASSKKSWHQLQNNFSLNNKILLSFFAAYFLGGIAGYLLHSPMQANEWTKIGNLRWIWGFFACYSAGYLLKSRDTKIRWTFLPLLLVLIAIIVKHFQETSGQFFSPDFRIQGFYSNPNYFAMAVVVLWATILPLAIYARSTLQRSITILIIVLASMILLATYTRTAWIAMLASVAVALFYTRSKKTALASVFVIGAFITAVLLNWFDLKDRIIYSFDFSGASSQGARFAVWNATWHIFLDHPIFGVGFEHAAKLYREYYVSLGQPTDYVPGHAHNQFLDILSGAGIVGLIGYLGAFGSGLVFFHRKFKSAVEIIQKQLSLGAILCIVALFGCSLTETPIIQQETRNYVLIILGFSYGYLANQRTSATASADS